MNLSGQPVCVLDTDAGAPAGDETGPAAAGHAPASQQCYQFQQPHHLHKAVCVQLFEHFTLFFMAMSGK